MIPRTFTLCTRSVRRNWPLRAVSVHDLRVHAGCRGVHVDCPPVVPSLTTSYAHGTSSVSLLHCTLGQMLLNATERFPDREAMVFLQDNVRKTFQQFQQDVERAAAGLLALGLNKGDRLGLWGPNTYEWVLFQFATAKAGIIMVAVNPAYQAPELEHALRKVGCKAVVCPSRFKTQHYCDMLRSVCPEIDTCTPGDIRSTRLPELRSVIVLDNREPGMFHLDDVMQAGSSSFLQKLRDVEKTLCCDEPINILFTSGTTGAPKGATLTHHNMVNNGYFVGKRIGYDWRPSPRICLPVPMYHCFGSVGGGVCMSVFGVTIVFPSAGYDGGANLIAMETERCTFLYGTPTMFIDLLNHPDLTKFDLSSVKAGIMAGSPCPPMLVKQVMDVMGIKEITVGYGTTENSPVTFCASPLDNLERKTETVGYIMDHTEAKVVNPCSGQVVPVGEQGEVLIRGYCVMLEYWAEPEKTADTIMKDGWYKTGDVGRLDQFGYLRIEGRIKDMIIRGGENVYPAGIEQLLHKHPKVLEAQVVGVFDPRLGEEICACIKLVDGQECSAQEIKDFCKGKISHFSIPRYVMFVSSFPLTITRKIQKNKLRDDMEEKLGLKKQQK